MLSRLAIAVCFLLAALPAAARNLALIVGNDSYQNVSKLQKARGDAQGYADFFTARGYDVFLHLDLDGRGMTEAVARFLDAIAPGDTVLFVFSGHGWSNGRENFLVPVDIRDSGSETLIQRESFPLKNGVNGIIDEIAARGPALTVAVIDACRNNPFAFDSGTRSSGLARGLVRIRPPTGTFIAYSAGEGQTALDRLSDSDGEAHSVFTRVFLKELARSNELQTAFKATQASVNELARSVGHQQRPAYYDEVIGTACIAGTCNGATVEPLPVTAPVKPTPETATPRVARPNAAEEWKDFKDTTSVAALRLFIERHQGTAYAALAMERIARLEEEAAAAAAPVQPLPQQNQQVYAPVAPTGLRPNWCPEAQTPTEVVICRDARLATLDMRLTAVYLERLYALDSTARAQLKENQRTWLADRDRCGADVQCVMQAYQERIAAFGG
ncbi:caspase family protein [Tropicimonas sp. IMCC6043]|uniref:caspase family protein n=1 Tax=Tropicimonas sp. IMCC6043 TaxID=2510645 RepID=UPI00101BBA4B|nr:caspase family protein [Tropicimonas sp. IMCC6043]RYH10071.1 DUF1311 domain-containing protein [Tropicimonas sp. IMCC6043]